MTGLVQRFTEINERNLQLDIFRENRQVLLQVFKYSDVKRWEKRPDFGFGDGYVIELRFSNGKTNNKANIKRFEESVIKNDYRTFQELEKGSFFSFISSGSGFHALESFVWKTIEQVYGAEVGRLDVQLNAY